MRHHITIVFDEYIPTGVGVVWTSQELNRLLGLHDAFSVKAVIDNVSATGGTFDLWVEHSSDGRTWLQRNDTTQTFPPPNTTGTGDIKITVGNLSNTTTNVKMFSDACLGVSGGTTSTNVGGPLMSFVRLAIKIGTVGAHVRVTFTGRGHAM